MEDAYLYGWLACDGSLEGNGRTVSLQVQQRDINVLRLFASRFGGHIETTPRVLKGRLYYRVRSHSVGLWDRLNHYFGGRLKAEKQFPADATTAFVVGCLDADGSFFLKHGYIAGEFQHASLDFTNGIAKWLESNGVPVNRHPQRPTLRFWSTACDKIRQFYEQVPCALPRKLKVLQSRPKQHARFWTDAQVRFLETHAGKMTHKSIAAHIGKTAKAVGLKIYRGPSS